MKQASTQALPVGALSVGPVRILIVTIRFLIRYQLLQTEKQRGLGFNMVTLRDVAKEAGVSAITVSRVLTGKHPEKVGDETRKRVLLAAERLGYQPNIAARALREQRTYQFALVVPYVHLSFIPEVIQALQYIASTQGYSCLLYLTALQPDVEHDIFQSLVARRVDGVIWLPGPTRVKEVEHILQDMPVVQLLYKEIPDAPAILVDQEQGAYTATQHLLQLGHRHIASLMHPDRHGTLRQKGIMAALAEAGLEPAATLTLTDASWEAAYETTQKSFAALKKATGLICYSDLAAWGAMRALNERGVNVPKDMSLTGYDDIPTAKYFETPLTTVAQPKTELGELAMQMLFQQIAGDDTADRLIVPDLVTRSSTAPPRTNGI